MQGSDGSDAERVLEVSVTQPLGLNEREFSRRSSTRYLIKQNSQALYYYLFPRTASLRLSPPQKLGGEGDRVSFLLFRLSY